ncbi:RNA-binding protein 15 [Fasciola hepatica]|uniref:RNA-binding protein 15 n=1 Tax=Fasciola hepatica TaxID=6192 RepID=A0A4E0RP91_FASHE|nr:RNA-binding protein 15 [Fasciola hepatica]
MKRQSYQDVASRSKGSRETMASDSDTEGTYSSSKSFNPRHRKALLRRPSPEKRRTYIEEIDQNYRGTKKKTGQLPSLSNFPSGTRSANTVSKLMDKNPTFSAALSRQLDRNSLSSLSSASMNRVDPVFAAAAAAAVMNAGFIPPNSADFRPGSLSTGSGSNSQAAAVAAVAAAAMNAAAMAAALGVGNMGMNNRSLAQTNRVYGASQPGGLRSSTSSNRSSRTASNSRYPTTPVGNNNSSNSHGGSSGRLRTSQGQHRRERDFNRTSNARFPHHLDHRDPEDDPTATRTLFVGNLMPEITEADLRSLFERYGFIEDIDIKRREPDSGVNAYAFIRFVNLDMAHRAKVDMSGELIGQFTCKIGYGKVVPTRCLWIGGLGPWITYPAFATLLDEFGPPERIIWPSGKNYANVLFPTVELAAIAANALRGYPLGGDSHRIRVDFTDESHIISDPLLSRRRPATSAAGTDHPSRKDSYTARANRESSHSDDGPSSLTSQTVRRLKRERKLSESDNGCSRNPNRSPPSRTDITRKSHRSVREQSSPKRKYKGTPSDGEMTDALETQVVSKVPTSQKSSVKDTTLSATIQASPQTAVNVEQLASCLPTAWDGAFFLKSSCFPCRMHILRGDQSLVDQFMSYHVDYADSSSRCSRDKFEKEEPCRKTKGHLKGAESEQVVCLRITQRMKLDPMKLEDVSQRIQTAGNSGFCVLLAVPSTSLPTGSYCGQNADSSDLMKQPQRPLRNLIAYLRTKDSAGVVLLNPLNSSQSSGGSDSLPVTGVLHAFPPCDFAFDLLKERAVHLQKEYTKDDHLVILLIRSTGGL